MIRKELEPKAIEIEKYLNGIYGSISKEWSRSNTFRWVFFDFEFKKPKKGWIIGPGEIEFSKLINEEFKYPIIIFSAKNDRNIEVLPEKHKDKTVLRISYNGFLEFFKKYGRKKALRLFLLQIKDDVDERLLRTLMYQNPDVSIKTLSDNPALLDKVVKKVEVDIIEKIPMKFDGFSEEEKSKILEKIEHSSIGTKIIEKYKELKSESPEIQLKSFMKVIDKLESEGLSELVRSVLSGDRLVKFVKEIENLSLENQELLMKNIPFAARLIVLYESLDESLKKFKDLIEKHSKYTKKDEKSVHSFLSENYWLLGIEYFDRVIKTSINEFGKKINETKFYKSTAIPDFTIEMINGNIDECVVIELEAPNDMIFKKDGNLSKEVFDGIHQAMVYTVLKEVEGREAHGIAVIGYNGETDKEKIKQLRILRNNYPFIKILTYNDMINTAQNVIKFLEEYRKKTSH